MTIAPGADDGDDCTKDICDPATGVLTHHSCGNPTRTTATTTWSAAQHLYSGSNPVQQGMPTGTISEARASVLRGKVLDLLGNALPGVSVSIHQHHINAPNYGSTLSQVNGWFDMAVNGGPVTVVYRKTGYPDVQRSLKVRPQRYAIPTSCDVSANSRF